MRNLIHKILKESLLTENRLDVVFNKYRSKYYELYSKFTGSTDHNLSDNLFRGLLTYNEDLIDSKYLDWFVKTYLQQWEGVGLIPPEKHVELFIQKINDFHINIDKIKTEGFKEHLKNIKYVPISYMANEVKILNNITDINTYPDFITLRFVVEESENYITPSQKKKIVKQETNKIYEDDNVLIIEPLSKASSCMYGSGTRWCTAAKDGNQFSTYKNDSGTLVYIIEKDSDTKWALQLGYEMLLSDFEYSVYTLYDEVDTEIHSGTYFGKGDLDEPLLGWVGLDPKPYRSIENFYNNRLRGVDDLS